MKYLSLFLFFIMVSSAYTVLPEKFEEALIMAYLNNPILQGEREALKAIDEKVPEALSGWRPKIGVEGQVGYTHTDQRYRTSRGSSASTSSGRSTYHDFLKSREANLSFEQPIFQGGRTIAQTKSAREQVKAGQRNIISVEQKVLFDALTAYMDVYKDAQVLSLTQKTEQVLTKHLEATQVRLSVGEVTRTDKAQAEARLASAKADRIKAHGNLENSKHQFERIMGYAPVDLLSYPNVTLDLPKSKQELLEITEKCHPNILAARSSERAARYDIKSVERELLPSLSIKGTLSHSDDTSSSNSRVRNATILANLSIPLYSSGSVEARSRQAHHKYRQKGH
ncbi:MAG: TolC family protein, partial [Epsilonproteobacteria bacterium]|nr:TolC family protein [Campylobacterota bacterium]